MANDEDVVTVVDGGEDAATGAAAAAGGDDKARLTRQIKASKRTLASGKGQLTRAGNALKDMLQRADPRDHPAVKRELFKHQTWSKRVEEATQDLLELLEEAGLEQEAEEASEYVAEVLDDQAELEFRVQELFSGHEEAADRQARNDEEERKKQEAEEAKRRRYLEWEESLIELERSKERAKKATEALEAAGDKRPSSRARFSEDRSTADPPPAHSTFNQVSGMSVGRTTSGSRMSNTTGGQNRTWIQRLREEEEPAGTAKSSVRSELETFSGEVTDWPNWAGMFKGLVHDTNKTKIGRAHV